MTNVIRCIYGWIRVMIKLLRPGGAKAIAAENIALRQQLGDGRYGSIHSTNYRVCCTPE